MSQRCLLLPELVFNYCTGHLADLSFWDSTQAGVEVKVFSACQKLIYGIKLWAVSHVLVDVQDVGQNAARRTKSKQTKP